MSAGYRRRRGSLAPLLHCPLRPRTDREPDDAATPGRSRGSLSAFRRAPHPDQTARAAPSRSGTTEIDTEVWSTSDFGAIQQNDFKTKANEIGFTAAYNFTKALQFTFGAQIKTTSFTRSNFKIVKPGADAFDKALIDLEARFNLPGQTKDLDDPLINNPQELSLVVSVTEDQMNLNAALGVRYDSRLADAFNDLSWYAEAKINTPLYSRTQSTSIEELTLTDSFNGWGVMARAGIRYQLKEHIAVMIGVDADKHERDKIAFEQVDGRRRTVPDISYSNVSVSAGLQWSY